MRHPNCFALAALLLVVPLAASAQSSRPVPGLPDKEATFGAFASPAALPAGSTAAYGFAGVPEVGAGYRMGVSILEADARLKFNYFALSLAVEGHARFGVLDSEGFKLAPSIGLGLVGNTGATYIDRDNFAYLAVRVIPGLMASYRVAETANVIGELTAPLDFSLAPSGGYRITPMLGGGGELYLGEDITAGAVALFGVDTIKEPLGIARNRFAYSFRVGVGYRFF